jgi:hypothetical protein
MVKPLSQMPVDLKRRVDKIDRDIQGSVRESVRLAALAAKAEQQDEMRRDAGGDLRLSRVSSGRGAAIGARYDLIGTGASTLATVKATGPVPLIANNVKAHRIPRANRRRRGVLSIPGIGVRASAQHPGTKGKDTWDDGRTKAVRKVDVIVAKRTDIVVRRSFQNGA